MILTKHDGVVIEEREGIATFRRKHRRRSDPCCRVGCAIQNVLRERDAIEVPCYLEVRHPIDKIFIYLVLLHSQTAMPVSSHFIAYIPPPCASNVSPYDTRLQSVIPHPALLLINPLQSVCPTGVPVKLFWPLFEVTRLHPGSVCQVTWLCTLSCTPSRISISPP